MTKKPVSGVETSLAELKGDFKKLMVFLKIQFSGIDQRFEAIDQRFDAMDQRFEIVDQRFQAIDLRFEAMDQRFEVIDGKFGTINDRFGVIDEQLSAVIGRLSDMHEDIEYLKENKADKADFQKIVDMLDAQNKEMAKNFQEHEMLVGQVDRHDKWINKIALQTDVDLGY